MCPHLKGLSLALSLFQLTPSVFVGRYWFLLLLLTCELLAAVRRPPLHHLLFRQRECSGFLKNLPKWHINSTLSEWLVPTLWSLVLKLIAVTSAVYVLTLRFTIVPKSNNTASVLSRWLAGVNQRITLPLFYSVIFLNTYSSLSQVLNSIFHSSIC